MDRRIEQLAAQVRDVPDFPKPGIMFKDITPLLASPSAFKTIIELMAEHYQPLKLDGIVAVESRGFIFGGALALELGVALHIVRKPGKLPYKTDSVEYSLEYGKDTLQMHQESLRRGDRVIVLDDLLATGGTAGATAQLAERQGGQVLECGFVIELGFLKGRDRLRPRSCFSLIVF